MSIANYRLPHNIDHTSRQLDYTQSIIEPEQTQPLGLMHRCGTRLLLTQRTTNPFISWRSWHLRISTIGILEHPPPLKRHPKTSQSHPTCVLHFTISTPCSILHPIFPYPNRHFRFAQHIRFTDQSDIQIVIAIDIHMPHQFAIHVAMRFSDDRRTRLFIQIA